MTSLVIGAFGLGLILVGVLTFRRQSGAANCPLHSRMDGRVAVTVASLSLIIGIGALTAAALVYTANPQLEHQQMTRFLAAVAEAFKGWMGIEEPAPYKQPVLGAADAEQAVNRLIAMGYLKFVTEADQPDVRRQLVETSLRRYLDTEWNDDCYQPRGEATLPTPKIWPRDKSVPRSC